jgi:hypothetical protein
MNFLAWFATLLSAAVFAVFCLIDVVRAWVDLDETADEEGPW